MNLFIKMSLLVIVFLISSIPYQMADAEDDIYYNPLLLYTPAIQSAVRTGLFNNCWEAAKELCEEDYKYCLMTNDEKIQADLVICHEINLQCLKTCSNNFQICKDNGGTGAECHSQLVICNAGCASEGQQCQLNAISKNHDILSAKECANLKGICLMRWHGECSLMYGEH